MSKESKDILGAPTCSFAEWVLTRLKKFANDKDRIAQIFADDGSSWTYDELLRQSVHVAAGLHSVGLHSGDVLSLIARNSHEIHAIKLGCIMSDIIIAPSVAESPPNELKKNFLLVKPKLVVAGETSIPAIEEAVAKCELTPKPRIFEIKQFFQDTTAVGSEVDPDTFQPAYIEDPKKHAFLYLFSSGTSGNQKAVSINDSGFLLNLFLLRRHRNVGDGPEIYTAQASWISSWGRFMLSLYNGSTRIFFNDIDFGDKVVHLLDAIQKFKPRIFCGPPPLISKVIQKMEDHPGRWDISSIKLICSTGDLMTASVQKHFSDKLNVRVCQQYGTTEIGCPMIVDDPKSPAVYGSIGKAVFPVKLVDIATGEIVKEPNTPGEIVSESYIMHDYVDNPEETKNAFDENGCFKTGDVAMFDKAGNYFIVNRIKDMFRCNGFQIAPSELETIISRLPGVKDVGVVGKYAGLGCDLPTAFVVKTEDSNVSEQDIHDCLAKENLHDAKRLRGGVIFTKEIPKNANGKIMRNKLREIVNQE